MLLEQQHPNPYGDLLAKIRTLKDEARNVLELEIKGILKNGTFVELLDRQMKEAFKLGKYRTLRGRKKSQLGSAKAPVTGTDGKGQKVVTISFPSQEMFLITKAEHEPEWEGRYFDEQCNWEIAVFEEE